MHSCVHYTKGGWESYGGISAATSRGQHLSQQSGTGFGLQAQGLHPNPKPQART